MKKIKSIIESGEYKDSLEKKRLFKAKCSPELFADLFIRSAKSKMYGGSFVVDDLNKETINQLYYYLIGSDQFNGDLIKGILMLGAIGNGKTILLESFIDVFNETANKVITNIHSKDISRILQEKEIGHLNKRPLFIDDIGKEESAIKNYGTVMKPLEDVINERYKNFGLTFGTSNYKFEDMNYSSHTKDRMKQMFNILILQGKTRRS